MASPSDNPLKRLIREIRRRPLWQVVGIYVVASGAVLVGVGTLGPGWFLPLALALLVVGLPVVLATASEPKESGCLIRLLVIDGIVRIAFGGIGVYAAILFHMEESRLADQGAGWILFTGVGLYFMVSGGLAFLAGRKSFTSTPEEE